MAGQFDPPSQPPTPPALGFGWVALSVRKVSDGVEDQGLGPWGIKQTCLACKTAQKHAVPDAPSPSEAGKRVNPSSTGKAGRDRHTMD